MASNLVKTPQLVLMSFKYNKKLSNPYSRLLVESLPPSFHPMSFSWKNALLSRYDVFHIHWPERLMRASSPTKTAVTRILLLILLLRCKLRHVPIVRTVHNESPHEAGGRIEKWLLSLVDKQTSHWIVMNSETHTPEGEPRFLIPHGDYRSWYDIPMTNKVKDHSLLFFGEIRPYKNVSGLCRTFIDLSKSITDTELTIMGRPSEPSITEELETFARNSDHIHLHLKFVPDSELIAAISAAHLIVLPYLRFHNSGAALLALSVGRPMLVPDCPAARELVAEFGDEYIKLFSGELTSTILKDVLNSTRTSDLPRPDMPERDWNRLGERVAEVYSDALNCRKQR